MVRAILWMGTVASIAAAAGAADLELSPAETSVSFELDSTLHRVQGRALLEEGAIHFDPEGGGATGRIVIDARSLDSDNALRDGQMHGKVLESERFPRIEFLPETILVEERDSDSAKLLLIGKLLIHGGSWPVRIPATVTREGERLRVDGSFVIPYVAWGMRDMSNFLLSVEPEVHIRFETLGRLTSAFAADAPHAAGDLR